MSGSFCMNICSCKVGAAFLHNRPKTTKCRWFWELVGDVSARWKGCFGSIFTYVRNLDLLLNSRVNASFSWVETKWPNIEQSTRKIMASAFWDAHRIVFIGQTTNNDSYVAQLVHSKAEITKNRPHIEKNKVLFHQDNALWHRSIKTMAKIH